MVLPPTRGRLDPSAARLVLNARNDVVRACYERAVRDDPTLRGEVVVRLRVEDDGTVSQTASSGESALRTLASCIEGALRTLRFAHPVGGAATVTAPYVFAPGE